MYPTVFPSLRNIFIWITLLGLHYSNAEWSAQKAIATQQKAKQLMNEFWEWRLREAPEFASKYGIHKYDAILEEYSEEAFVHRRNNASEMLKAIDRLDKSYLGQTDQVSLAVMADMIKTYVDGFTYRKMTAYVPLRSGVTSVSSSWFRVLRSTQLGSAEGYRNLLRRYQLVERQADQMINLTREALALNYSWTQAVLRESAPFTNENLRDLMNQLIAPFENMDSGIDNDTRVELIQLAKTTIAHQIIPAVKRIHAFVEKEYRPKARPEVGVSALPGGREMYEACLRWHLSINMTAQQVHDLGLKEVDRIYKLMGKIRDKESFRGDVRGFVAHLMNQTENMYNSSDDMMSNIHQLLTKIKVRMPEVLLRVPTNPMRILERPSNLGPLGSYQGSPLDESRPAAYYANTYMPETSARFNMMPVVLHETEPGHHVQAAYKKEIDLPMFRQASDYSKFYAAPFNWPFYTAYVEGWGLYSEYLGEELGLYEEPYGLLGRYSGEMLRACRLVVDTGIHAFGYGRFGLGMVAFGPLIILRWSQERAQAYIANHTALSQTMIFSEVNRYISWPGQSCAYKIGELKIKELRTLCETTLGDKFDLREFHHQILSLGPVPLQILESSIRNWLKEGAPHTGSGNTGSSVYSAAAGCQNCRGGVFNVSLAVALLVTMVSASKNYGDLS